MDGSAVVAVETEVVGVEEVLVVEVAPVEVTVAGVVLLTDRLDRPRVSTDHDKEGASHCIFGSTICGEGKRVGLHESS